jgi:hypothetical protein
MVVGAKWMENDFCISKQCYVRSYDTIKPDNGVLGFVVVGAKRIENDYCISGCSTRERLLHWSRLLRQTKKPLLNVHKATTASPKSWQPLVGTNEETKNMLPWQNACCWCQRICYRREEARSSLLPSGSQCVVFVADNSRLFRTTSYSVVRTIG